MRTRAILLFVIVAIFVLSVALPALGGGIAKPKPFHDADNRGFAAAHSNTTACFAACHKGFSGHDLCGACHDLVAQCGACHAVAD